MPLEGQFGLNSFHLLPGGHIYSNNEQVLLSLPTKFGRLGIPVFHKKAGIEFDKSRKLTSSLTNLIKDQSVLHSVNGTEQQKTKTAIKTERENMH